MKKLITLLTGLLFVALSVGLTGCDDSDEQVNRPDERFVSGVVIPTALDVCEGLEMTIEGQGFLQGDAVTLRGDSDMPAQTTGITPSSISFVLPDGLEDQTAYKFLLVRNGELQALGASRLTLKLAVNIDLGGTITGSWNEEASIRGNGFTASDELILTQGGGKFSASVTQADNQSLRFRIPQTAVDGDCEFTLRRGDKEQTLGTAKLALSLDNTIPDQTGASIKGMVHYGGKGIENVLVSDGDRITATDANGYYWLASDKRNGLAFVIQPLRLRSSHRQGHPPILASLHRKRIHGRTDRLPSSSPSRTTTSRCWWPPTCTWPTGTRPRTTPNSRTDSSRNSPTPTTTRLRRFTASTWAISPGINIGM